MAYTIQRRPLRPYFTELLCSSPYLLTNVSINYGLIGSLASVADALKVVAHLISVATLLSITLYCRLFYIIQFSEKRKVLHHGKISAGLDKSIKSV